MNNRTRTHIWIVLIFCIQIVVILPVAAQKDTTNLSELSLEELLDLEVFTADKKGTALRETPGVMTVISHEDIIHSGARDLLDVLKLLVPGFEFGIDVEGVVGIGMRGIWAHEGKILLLIDGMECNEDLFSNTLYGNHYLVENIDRIEIVRGPGSAIYGGYAGLGVINIITKSAMLNGGYAGVLYSQMSESFSHRNMHSAFGRNIGDWHFGATAVISQGVRSQSVNTDYLGNVKSMKNMTDINTYNLNTHIKYKDLTVRLLADMFQFDMIDVWGENSEEAISEIFDQYSALVNYEWQVSEKLKIVPQIQYKFQTPWNTDIPEQEYACTKTVNKTWGNVSSFWKLNEKSDLISGLEVNNTLFGISDERKPYEELYRDSKTETGYLNYAFFNQFTHINQYANITIGARYDYSTVYGSSFVPRIGLTKASDLYHIKLMISQSFRIPGGMIPERVPIGVPSIVPEKATNYEVEAGLKLWSTAYVTVNVYSVVFDKIITYGRDATTGVGTYRNKGKLGTLGGELELKQKSDKLTIILNYAFYRATKRDAANFLVPDNSGYFLAFAPHKLNLYANYKINEHISISPKFSLIGKRFAYSQFDENTQEDVLSTYEPQLFAGLFLNMDDMWYQGLNLDMGISNILDEKELFLQPYRGSHAPLPGLSRAIQFRIFYEF